MDSHRFVLDGGRADAKVEFVLVLCNATIIICTIITVLVIIIISTNEAFMIIILNSIKVFISGFYGKLKRFNHLYALFYQGLDRTFVLK